MVKDLVVSRLWHGFDPWSGNVHMLRAHPPKIVQTFLSIARASHLGSEQSLGLKDQISHSTLCHSKWF